MSLDNHIDQLPPDHLARQLGFGFAHVVPASDEVPSFLILCKDGTPHDTIRGLFADMRTAFVDVSPMPLQKRAA